MHSPAESAFVAASQALLAMAIRQVLALEKDDSDVAALVVECDGVDVTLTLLGGQGHPIGGYTL